MKFGIFTIVPWHESKGQQQSLDEALEQIELADQLGIDEVWLGEHRFSRHGLLSGIWSFAGLVAGRTKNIRIGTAVVVLPLLNPIRRCSRLSAPLRPASILQPRTRSRSSPADPPISWVRPLKWSKLGGKRWTITVIPINT